MLHALRPTVLSAGTMSAVKKVERLSFPFQTPDPFLFAVYHDDKYPPGDGQMRAPRRGDGADFNPSAEYRMYHGERVPGFPQHPHRGFETITATMEGLVDHTDSVGNAGRYGQGDVQWMTAGKGIVHGEMFPLVNDDAPNPLRLFQIWLNLPAASKMVDTAFVMHWAEDVRTVSDAEAGYELVVWAGECDGCAGQPPPPHSWAADPNNDVSVYFITVNPGGSFTIPPSKIGGDSNRTTYFFEGEEASIDSTEIPAKSAVTMDASVGATITVPSSASVPALLLVLQGRPIGEPVAQHGPFVMNTREEINKAFSDYQATRFGGWPWPEDAVVFPKDKGRFALVDGTEMRPPGYATSRAKEDL
jgi:hypothetical protein